MSEIFTEQLTAIANIVLAVFAIVTAVFAWLAFQKQSREISGQAEMLELQRQQLGDQRKATADQAEVLKLQAADLREALEERKRHDAAGVSVWFARHDDNVVSIWGARIRNASGLPVYDVRVAFRYIDEQVKGLGWNPISQGTTTETIRVLAPGSERFVVIPTEISSQIAECSDEVYAVSIAFTDASGNRWERDPKGALHPWA